MAKYKVDMEWSGYSRGTLTYIIEAKSEDEAKEIWCEGEKTHYDVVRDDTEIEIVSVELIED